MTLFLFNNTPSLLEDNFEKYFACGYVIVYDTTDKDSFKKIPQILKQIYDYAKPDSSIILVGTKSDLVHKRQGDL